MFKNWSIRKKWRIGSLAVVVVIGVCAGVWYYAAHRASAAPAFPINPQDTISSWNFKGAYSGNATLTQQALGDEAKITAELPTASSTKAYDLYISIGNDANLLGDGKQAYDAYDKAAALYPNQGLPYLNLGHLFDELGAYYTAADAYAKAVHVEPGVLEFDIERLTFLTQQFPHDSAMIQAAVKDAYSQFGDTAPVLEIEAQWLEGLGKYADAIKAWQGAKQLSPGQNMSAINAAIARDEAKLHP